MIGKMLDLAEPSVEPASFAEALAGLDRIVTSGKQAGRELVERVEREVSAAPYRALSFDATGFATLTAAGHEWAAGRFESQSIGELLARAAALPRSSGRCRLFVIRGSSALADIGALQAFDDGDTVFQVASQFNCLEAPAAHVVPVAQYFGDSTQGPRVSISAFPGTLQRHYAAPDGAGGRFVQSTGGRQINLLHDVYTTGVARVQSGYLTSRDIANPAALAAQLESSFDAIRIGVHEGVGVALGHNWNGFVADPHPLITQVFTSTLAAGMYSSGAQLDDAGPWRTIALQLLRAAYLGTLLAAVTLQKRRVLLTMIGGGVFGNPHDLIAEAVAWALEEVERGGAALDVVVNVYTGDAEPFLPEVRARGGAVIQVGRPAAVHR